MFCEKCGATIPAGSKFCASCGAKTEAQPLGAAGRPTAPPPPPPAYMPPVQTAPPPPSGQQYSVPPRPAQPFVPPVAAPAAPAQNSYGPPGAYGVQAQAGSEVLSIGQYVVMFLLMMVPILNIILLFVWGFGSNANLNRRNFAKAALIMAAVALIFSIFAGGILARIIAGLTGGYY